MLDNNLIKYVRIIFSHCLSYFSIALKRHHMEGNLQKKMFSVALGPRELKSLLIMVGSMVSAVGMCRNIR